MRQESQLVGFQRVGVSERKSQMMQRAEAV